MPSNAQHHFHLPAQEWELQQQEFTFVRQRLDSTTLGVFSNLKDSMVLIPNSWKCFKSTDVFENIQVFQLGSTKSPGLDSLGMEFLGSAPHLGIPCPTAAPPNFQAGSAGIHLLCLGTEEEHFQKNLQFLTGNLSALPLKGT